MVGVNEGLYDTTKATIAGALLLTDDSTTLGQTRHMAHDAVFDIFRAVCKELREHPDLNLEQALFMFGERL